MVTKWWAEVVCNGPVRPTDLNEITAQWAYRPLYVEMAQIYYTFPAHTSADLAKSPTGSQSYLQSVSMPDFGLHYQLTQNIGKSTCNCINLPKMLRNLTAIIFIFTHKYGLKIQSQREASEHRVSVNHIQVGNH